MDEALAESERNEARCYLAELVRVKSELVLRAGADGAPYISIALLATASRTSIR
jgi:hypothetical protein